MISDVFFFGVIPVQLQQQTEAQNDAGPVDSLQADGPEAGGANCKFKSLAKDPKVLAVQGHFHDFPCALFCFDCRAIRAANGGAERCWCG